MTTNPEALPLRRLLAILAFLVVGSALLGGAFLTALRFYPVDREEQQAMAAMGMPQQEVPLWRRLLDQRNRRPAYARNRPRGSRPGKVGEVAAAEPGALGIALPPEQLALREIVEAQIILRNQFGVTDQQAHETVRQTPIQGPFRAYEDQRFISRLHLMRFLDNQNDRRAIQALRESALKTVRQADADFEEYYYAGIACLVAGDSEQATTYLDQALERWPARGRGFGNVYFFVMICRAVRGNSEVVFAMLSEFQQNYPDWLYVETYMPDLNDLVELYPRAPLIQAIQGYAYALVNNHAAAVAAYDQALRSGRLDAAGKEQLQAWRDALAEARRP
jgi:tetratricopeptide (TPR) repeat protein